MVHRVHDLDGNVIAEYHASGYLMTEYVWLEDRPIAVIADAGGTPRTLWVHTDHLERPFLMTNAAGNVVWEASYKPFGEVASITGAETLDHRFPGQWFQMESGLHYNWHRHYDATTGRYVSPDPIGMPDGPSRYAYVGNNPLMSIDRRGLTADDLRKHWWYTPPGFWPYLYFKPPAPNYCMATESDEPPFMSIPQPGSPDWCKWVKNECIRECGDMTFPTKNYGWTFQRCVNQCMYDNNCGGIDYPEGFWPGLGLGPKPWEGWKK